MSDSAPRPLERFQDAFARALLATDAAAEAGTEVGALVREPAFAVYRNTVMKGCIDALEASYPALVRLTGEAWFRAAAALYARAHPPRHPTLLDYGRDFADFLAAFEPAAAMPYLAGVAHLERCWSEAHVARDEPAVDSAALARLEPEALARAVLAPHAAARWAAYPEYPIVTLWQRNRDPQAAADLSDVEWRGEAVLVVRPRDSVAVVPVGRGVCAFLDACAARRSLGDAASAALAAEPEIDLAPSMALLLESGAFSQLTVYANDRRGGLA